MQQFFASPVKFAQCHLEYFSSTPAIYDLDEAVL